MTMFLIYLCKCTVHILFRNIYTYNLNKLKNLRTEICIFELIFTSLPRQIKSFLQNQVDQNLKINSIFFVWILDLLFCVLAN